MLTITSVLVVLSLLFGGTGVAVVAAQDSLPGEVLYTVKTTTEDIQYRLTLSEEAKLGLALHWAGTRIAEATAMAGNGTVATEQVVLQLVERLEQNLKDALLAAAAMDDTEAGLTKIKEQIHIWEVVDYKRDRDQGGKLVGPTYQIGIDEIYNIGQNMRKIVESGLVDPGWFREMVEGQFGKDLQDLSLLGSAGDVGSQAEGPVGVTGPQGQQGQSGQGQIYSDGPNAQNGAYNAGSYSEPPTNGDRIPFETMNKGTEGFGPGPGVTGGTSNGSQIQDSGTNKNQP
jgi:hypothetical protein